MSRHFDGFLKSRSPRRTQHAGFLDLLQSYRKSDKRLWKENYCFLGAGVELGAGAGATGLLEGVAGTFGGC